MLIDHFINSVLKKKVSPMLMGIYSILKVVQGKGQTYIHIYLDKDTIIFTVILPGTSLKEKHYSPP